MGNSVIYRPAYDAEVEYLESTGTQWIDTGVKPDSTYTFDCKVAKIQSNYNCVFWGTRNSGESTTFNEQCYLNANDFIPITKFAEINLFSTSTDTPESNWNSGITPIVNTMYELTGMTVVSTMNQMTYPITLFGFNMIGVIYPSLGICRIGYWKCYSNGVLVRDMIPVRIGSVGYLYDKVSKQLFANKGTGNFVLGNDVSNAVIPQQRCVLYFGNQRSVGFERIYEEYEWLIGDGTAFIDTLLALSDSDAVEMKITGGTLPSASQAYKLIFGNNTTSYNYNTWVLFVGSILAIRPTKTSSADEYRFQISTSQELTISQSTTSITVNGTEVWSGTSAYTEISDNCKLFTSGTNVTHCYDGKVAYLKISNKLNLTPCRLLRPLPAILDGNGIARQAGECGMWDKVSNKFYGNVANSGTFTVKGPKCYEEYKWLRVSVSTNVDMAILPVNSTNLYFKHKHIRGLNYHYFMTTGEGVDYYYYYESNTHRCSVWNQSTKTVVYSNSDITVTEDEIVINCNSSNMYVNGYDIPIYGSTIKQVSIIAKNRNGFEGLISSITIDGIERYIPCKLTHGIPASMDANGIARPAGTCGMWDKVNDVFYGNVASSGTFTVSND